MLQLLQTLLHLAEEEPYATLMARGQKPETLLEMAKLLEQQGRAAEMIPLVNQVRRAPSLQTDALRLSTRAQASTGQVEEALQGLLHYKQQQESLLREIMHGIFGQVASLQSECLANGQVTRAVHITRMVSQLLPEVDFSQQLAALTALEFETLQQLLEAAKTGHQYDQEMQLRLMLFRHPARDKWSQAMQLDNIYYALSLLFYDTMDAGKMALAREMIAYTQSLSPTVDTTDYFKIFERFYQLLIGCINLDVIFGPPLPASWPPLPFFSCRGEAVTTAQVQERIQNENIEVIFLTSASQLFASRFTGVYLSAIRQSCDCNYLAIISVSTSENGFFEVIDQAALQDERVLFYRDDYDPLPGDYLSFSPNNTQPLTLMGHYYASVGLLLLGNILHHLQRPVFVTGIDTVLNQGVGDLLTHFKDHDVVFNVMPERSSMASQLINSLLLFNPTENAMILAAFFKHFFGPILFQKEQPAYIDQLILVLAKHHLLHCDPEAKLGYFSQQDINNLMFNTDNIEKTMHLLKLYRFVNIFSSGNEDKELAPEEVLAMLKSPTPDL
ncbi:MAG: hypothetical protein G8345_21945 [Magnetococcales bacterium]|nr:hypothetical protein [Magnetococcales bacterium]